MSTTYAEALEMIRELAQERSAAWKNQLELVPLDQAVGRIIARDNFSPVATPLFDTSAMDGFAVSSGATSSASEENPVVLCVKGIMAAGDAPISVSGETDDDIVPCVEIMTGARFPESSGGPAFDACIPLEHTLDVPGKATTEYRKVIKPVNPGQHRRLAGSDFQSGERVVSAGTVLQPQHIMALTSVGIAKVGVRRKVRIGIWSTGSELCGSSPGGLESNKIPDVNGPYLKATLEDEGHMVTFFGTVSDEPDAFSKALCSRLASRRYDIFITTGAVSAGKFDFVRQVLESVGSKVEFHKIAIRPGHPVLLATLPTEDLGHMNGIGHVNGLNGSLRTESPIFFGLPGNPLAAAACLWFLAIPYLRYLEGQPQKVSIEARATVPEHAASPGVLERHENDRVTIFQGPPHLDIFRHGRLDYAANGWEVRLTEEQSPAKVKPFSTANCWVHIPRGHGALMDGDFVRCYPLEKGLGGALCS